MRGGPHSGIVGLETPDRNACPSLSATWGHREKADQSSPHQKPTLPDLDLGLSCPQKSEEIHFCCLSPPVYVVILSQQPELTETRSSKGDGGREQHPETRALAG